MHRLKTSLAIGATDAIDNTDGGAVQRIMEATGGQGVDVAIEAIGTPQGWYICEDIVAKGGNIAILGVHGKPVTLHLERMWRHNFTMTAGLVHTTSIPAFMDAVQSGRIHPERLISHRLTLGEAEKAYAIFGNAAEHRALKVLIHNDLSS
jgi:alcohol dehydrogenase